jgi:hypothetical protein
MSIEASGVLGSRAAADGRVKLPESLTPREAGSMVDFLPVTEVGR